MLNAAILIGRTLGGQFNFVDSVSGFDAPMIRVPFPAAQIGSVKQRQSLFKLLCADHGRSDGHQADQRDDGVNGKPPQAVRQELPLHEP